jgi:hypothetical protein
MFENRVVGRICGPKRNEVAGLWRKLYNKRLLAVTAVAEVSCGFIQSLQPYTGIVS